MARSRRKSILEPALAGSETPIFLFDDRQIVRFFNAGCEKLLGWKAEDVVGTKGVFGGTGNEQGVELLTASLCPPPEVFSGQPVSIPMYLVDRKGKRIARAIDFYPLIDEEGKVDGVLGFATIIREPVTTRKSTSSHQLHTELASMRIELRQRYGTASFLGKTVEMRRALDQIRLAGTSDVDLLIVGPQGTGKEHAARTIHFESARKTQAFVPIDCRVSRGRDLRKAIERLIVSEQPTAATGGAPMLQPGTLFLSAVEKLPADLQQMLLEAGSPDKRGFRIIASSTLRRDRLAGSEAMRADFFYGISALCIELPALAQRLDDLPLLAQAFVESGNRLDRHQVGGMSREVEQTFSRYNWPGNLDELRSVIAEARQNCNDSTILMEHMPFRFRAGIDAQEIPPAPVGEMRPLDEVLQATETELINKALDQTRQNKSLAAKLLGLTRARLYRRMEALGIAFDAGEDDA